MDHLLDLKKLPKNQYCFNCQDKFPDWADLSYGIFICRTCAGRHRGFGTKVSRIMSTVIDKWTERQIYHMESGNIELIEYINNNKILDKYTNKKLIIDPDFFLSNEGLKYKEMIQNKVNEKYGIQIPVNLKGKVNLEGVKKERTSSGFAFGNDSERQSSVENTKPFIERSIEKITNFDYKGSFNDISEKTVELFHKGANKLKETASSLSKKFKGETNIKEETSIKKEEINCKKKVDEDSWEH